MLSRGERNALIPGALVLLGLLALVNEVRAETLMLTSAEDGNLKEEGRYGVISLSPSTSALNYTINLSGILVLGLGVAAATMFWAHISTLSDNTLKRSLSDDEPASLAVALNNMHRRFERAEIYELPCRQRIICEIGAEKKRQTSFPENSFGFSVDSFFGSVNRNKALMRSFENHPRAKNYLMAWNEGKGGKICRTVYGQCFMTKDSINKIVDSSQ